MNNLPSNSPSPTTGKQIGGAILIIIGMLALLKQMGFYFPHWLVGWPMLMIAGGLFISFRHNFRHPVGYFLMAAGTIFLADDLLPGFQASKVFFPIMLIILGLWMIFGRFGRHYGYHHYRRENEDKNPPDASGV